MVKKITHWSKSLMQIFRDDNDWNEKTIIGFVSFAIMVIVVIADLVCTILGINLNVKEYMFDAFVFITLGSFGVAGAEKFSGSAKIKAKNQSGGGNAGMSSSVK